MKQNAANEKRKQFTKDCIFDSLVILLRTKKIEDISVSELTQKAGFSRMAFYRNYDSLMDVILKHFDEKPLGYAEEFDVEHYDMHDHATCCFAYFKENQEIINYLIQEGKSNLLLEYVDKHIKTTFRPVLKSFGVNQEYEITVLSGVIFMILNDWAKKGMIEDSAIKARQVFTIFDMFRAEGKYDNAEIL